MPPARGRKKRAPPKLAVVQETAFQEDDEEAAQQQQDAQTTERDPLQQLRDKLEQGDVQVEEAAAQMWDEVLEDVDRMRQEFKLLCMKIPKKVRDISIAQFFSLTEEESQLPTISNLHARLAAMVAPAPAADTCQPQTAAVSDAQPVTAQAEAEAAPIATGDMTTDIADAAGSTAAATTAAAADATAAAAASSAHAELMPPPSAAPATRMTRRTAARTGAAAPELLALPATTTKRRTRATAAKLDQPEPPPCFSAATPLHAPRRPEAVDAAHMQPPLDGGAQGAQGVQGVVARPRLTARQAAKQQQVMDTPHGKAVAGGPSSKALVEATPAFVGRSALAELGANPGAGAPHALLGGFTLVRKEGRPPAAAPTPGGGKAGAAAAGSTATDDAMIFTTAGGEQFVLDGERGLAGIPAPHRADVQRQVELLQRLAAAALARG